MSNPPRRGAGTVAGEVGSRSRSQREVAGAGHRRGGVGSEGGEEVIGEGPGRDDPKVIVTLRPERREGDGGAGGAEMAPGCSVEKVRTRVAGDWSTRPRQSRRDARAGVWSPSPQPPGSSLTTFSTEQPRAI